MDFDQTELHTFVEEITGNNTAETLEGESTSDLIEAGGGDDTVNGGKGDDQIEGGLGEDTLEGDKGDDLIKGGRGGDTLEGGAGHDTLDGGKGDDLLIGGRGDDVYVLSRGDDTIHGFKSGDSIVLSQELLDAGVTTENILKEEKKIDGKKAVILTFNIDGNVHTTTIIGSENAEEIEIAESPEPTGVEGELIIGHETDQTLTGTDGADTIRGGSGDELLQGKQGWDVLLGGNGNDQLVGNEGGDYLNGGNGNDDLKGGGGNDDYVLSTGIDFIDGLTSNEVDGFDKILIPHDFDVTVVEDILLIRPKNGGYAHKTLVLGIKDKPLRQYLHQLDAEGNIIQTEESDYEPNPTFDTVQGTEGNDELDGSEGKDLILGFGGNDLIKGKESQDQLEGGEGKDTLKGAAGEDDLFGGGGDDTLDGGAGVDMLEGNSGNDMIVASKGNDWAWGFNVEEDTLAIPEQYTYSTSKLGGSLVLYTIYSDSGIEGSMTLELIENGEQKDVKVVKVDSQYRIIDKSFAPTEEIESISKTIDLTNDSDDWSGKSDNEEVNGKRGDDTLRGKGGQDLLRGQSGEDVLEGGSNDDDLYGGDGADTLNGNDGNDFMEGGQGRDLFVVSEGKDVVFDFNVSQDLIEIPRGYKAEFNDDLSSVTIELKKEEKVVGKTILFKTNKDQQEAVGRAIRYEDQESNESPGMELTDKGTDGDDELITGTEDNKVIAGLQGNDAIAVLGGSGNIIHGGNPGTGFNDYERDLIYAKEGSIYLNNFPDKNKGNVNEWQKDLLIIPDEYEGYNWKFDTGYVFAGKTDWIRYFPVDEDKNEIKDASLKIFVRNDASGGSFKLVFPSKANDDYLDGNFASDVIFADDRVWSPDNQDGAKPYELTMGFNFVDDEEHTNNDISKKFTAGKFDNTFNAIEAKGDSAGDWSYFVSINEKVEGKIIFNGDDKADYYGLKDTDFPVDSEIHTKGGNDTIRAKTGEDFIDAGSGNDYVLGDGAKIDNDPISKNNNDTIYGDDGNDTLYGANGNDELYGGQGKDFIHGGLQGAEFDPLDGLIPGYDVLQNDGKDTLDGGINDDTLKGGSGSDQYRLSHGNDRIQEFDTDSDQILIPSDVLLSFKTVDSLHLELTLKNDEGVKLGATLLENQAQNREIIETAYEKARNGEASKDDLVIYGDDPILLPDDFDGIAYVSDDIVRKFIVGEDKVELLKAFDYQVYQDGNDTVITGNHQETGTNFRSRLKNVDTDAFLEANSIIQIGEGDGQAGTGINVIEGTSESDSPETLASKPEGEYFVGSNGRDSISGFAGADLLKGKGGNDTLLGGKDDDVLEGENGADQLLGGGGEDDLLGGEGDDTLDGGNHDDTLKGGAGNDTYLLSNGWDLIEGYKKGDQIALSDALIDAGIKEEDVQQESTTWTDPDSGKEKEAIKLSFSNGDKHFSTIVVSNQDEVAGFPLPPDYCEDNPDSDLCGSGGGDGGTGGGDGGTGGGDLGGSEVPGFPIVPDYCESNPDDESCKPTIDDEVIEPSELRKVEVTQKPKKSSFDDIQRGSKQPDKFIGSSSIDKLTGKDKADILKGKGGDDYLYGDKHSDTLRGGKGKDVLQGGSGKDDLAGGRNSDVLYGGSAADVLTGNGGRDIFVLSSGKDVITDFKIGKDDIGLVYALNLNLKQKGNDLLIKGNDNVSTLLLGVDKNDFLADQGDPSLLPIVEVDVL